MKLWICFLFIGVAFRTTKADDSYEYYDFSEELQPDSKEIEKTNLVLPESTYLKEEGENISTENDSRNDFLGNDSEASDIGILNDKVENIDDFDNDGGFSLDEDDNIPDSDQKVFDDIENYRKLLSADGDNLDNYQFEDNRSNNVESKEDVDTMSNEKESQNREKVDTDDDTMSKEKINSKEEINAYGSDFDTMLKKDIANDQNESKKSEVDKDDNSNYDLGTLDEPVDSVLKDNDEPDQDDENYSFEFYYSDDLLEKMPDENAIENKDDESKLFKPIKNYEDVDDELPEEEDNSEVVNIDSNLSDIFKEAETLNGQDLQDNVDAMTAQKSTQSVDTEEEIKLTKEKSYGNDAIYDENPIDNLVNDNENLQFVVDKLKEELDGNVQNVDVIRTADTEKTSEAYDEQMEDFIVKHKEELDTYSRINQVTGAPIHKNLSADQAVLITNPDSYPANEVYDWILDGDGAGIEFNITSLNLNGDVGQYLLVIPGGQNDADSDGFVFTWQLRQPRMYRFLGVDRMFIRFVTGSNSTTQLDGIESSEYGFSLSVKHILPTRYPDMTWNDEDNDAEIVLPTPTSFMWVYLGGVNATEFVDNIQEDFRLLVADMATFYINENDIKMGLNTTQETTQIVNATFCNIEWPNFRNCTAVRFAVPLVYDDQDDVEDEDRMPRLHEKDLIDMWESNIHQDPFAARLRRLGVTLFPVPNDGRVLMIWLVVTVSVILLMGIVAYVVWHYNCFDNYTKMSPYSDTTSVCNEKQFDDLFPTPHQTLPPLFSDEKYDNFEDKFDDSTRMDMGGFTNRGYMRDNPFDSDDEMDTRERQTNSRPEDASNV
ncbi:uncharacterized protein LOC113238606 isoform X2 [Hyposmocoma kahamanoa]|uniref:uncharacterized protein LOC113238606 isoform X2 n=1 Tax=Hyposmocoma kahamanoa TaxID=1477025 RepID=UPI000E6D8DDA|nr:uncharacterized protein LOC113238606 isoform X2 [Hyposmocoma kahamanoa]